MSAKLSRRDFLRSAAGATTAAALAPVAGTLSASAPRQDDITLSFWMFADNRVTWMESFFEEIWGPENPNVTVEIEHVPYSDLWPKVQAVFVAGSGVPDMVDVAVGELGQFLRGGDENFLRIDDYIGDEIDDLSIPSATKNWTIRGNIYGVGNEVNPLLLYYRTDLFEELGLDPDGITTWQDYTETYGAVAQENGRALHYIAVDDATDFQLFYYQAGGQFFDDNENVTILDDDLAVEVLTWMKENYDAGVFIDRGTWDGQYAIMNNSDVIATKGAPWFQGFMKSQPAGPLRQVDDAPDAGVAGGRLPERSLGRHGHVHHRRKRQPRCLLEFHPPRQSDRGRLAAGLPRDEPLPLLHPRLGCRGTLPHR